MTSFWPLTNRGLFSELLVYAYIKTIYSSHQLKLDPCVAYHSYDYWRHIIGNCKLKKIYAPSNYLNPVSPPNPLHHLLSFIGFREIFLSPKQKFSFYWRLGTDCYYMNSPLFLAKIKNTLSELLDHSYQEINSSSIKYLSFNTNLMNVIHVRAGDKIHNQTPEINNFSIQHYIRLCNLYFPKNQAIYIISDSLDTALALQRRLKQSNFQDIDIKVPDNTIHTLGYDQRTFNKMSTRAKVSYTKVFLNDFFFMISAQRLICDYRSCVARVAYLLRDGSNIYSINSNHSIIQ